ncbi:Tfp pilus assembly protein FimT/FimU [Aquipseudomonas alcaligenes]|uniref:pilus assembly FimT family protein n=1 Tax=Aquipseudomonas alcaligenes TaxID=43263 RepID=UPI00374A4986
MRGFTLVELLMVMVIMGILAIVVGPRFFERSVFDQRLYYEEALSAVRYGQKLALASGCQIQVSLNNTSGYSVQRAASCTTGNYVDVQGPDGQTPYARALPSGVIVTSTSFPVVFSSQGQPSAAAAATISGFTINVAAITGLVQ